MVAFEQFHNRKMALIYRVLDDDGYVFRTRIVDFGLLSCSKKDSEFNISSADDVDLQFEDAIEAKTLYTKKIDGKFVDYDYEFTSPRGENVSTYFEDFVMPTRARITALNLLSPSNRTEGGRGVGDKLTYSQIHDVYEYRTISKAEEPNDEGLLWQQGKAGPVIDKTDDQVYICTGLNYVDLKKRMVEESWPEEAEFGNYLIVISIRGPRVEDLNITMTGHAILRQTEVDFEEEETDPLFANVGWFRKNVFKSTSFRVS